MRQFRLSTLALAVSAALSSTAHSQIPEPPATVPAQAIVSADPLRMPVATGTLTIQFSQPIAGQLLFTLSPLDDSTQPADITALADQSGATAIINFAAAPPASGLYTLRIFAVAADGASQDLGSVVFDIPAIQGTGVATTRRRLDYKLDVGLAAQLQERAGGSQVRSSRPQYHDATLQGSVSAEDGGEDWEIRAQAQLAGASFRPQTVSFGKLRSKAPKVDLQSYVIDGGWRDTRFHVGHIMVDIHPLLHTGLSNRGFSLQQRLPFGFDLGIAMQNGSQINGYRDLLGISTRNNQHRSLGLGYDFVPNQPGKFRIDLTTSEARVAPLFGGGAGSDESRGYGARIAWRNDPGTLRLETVLAKSDFTPAPSPFPVGTPGGSGRAGTMEAGYDLFKDVQVAGRLPVSLSFGARTEYSSPLYRSLGSFFSANYRMQVGTGTLRTGPATTQLQVVRRHDNVGADSMFIRNRVDASSLNVNLPLGELLNALRPPQPAAPPASDAAALPQTFARPSPWVPTLSFLQQLTHGYGDRGFIPLGYTSEDLPNVYITNHAVGLAWQFEKLSVNLRTTRTGQTNRQTGFEQQSTWDRRHSISVDWRPLPTLSLSLGYDPSLNYRYDTGVHNDARQIRGSVNWMPDDKWQVTVDLNHSADFDSLDTRYNRQNNSQVQVSRRFILDGPQGRKVPGQAYVRAVQTRGFNATAGGPVLEPSVTRLQAGFTLSLF